MMLGMDLPLWLRGIHGLLLAVVIYTDLTRHKVYLPWSVLSVLVGLATALVSPWPTVNLVFGAFGFLWGLYGLSRAHWAGGDVWMLTYLGLTFGLSIAVILLLTAVGLLIGIVSRQLRWGQTIPLAGFWGLAAIVVVAVSLLLPPVATPPAHSIPMSPAPGSASVPLPTLTPNLLLREHAQQAADAVALIGLVDVDQRPTQARRAAQTLRSLAQTTPVTQHAWLLTWWAEAVEHYAAGQPGALTFIKQFSHLNHAYRKGEHPDAHQ